jgi:hypothetical protein
MASGRGRLPRETQKRDSTQLQRRASPNGARGRAHSDLAANLLALQRSAGNKAVSGLLAPRVSPLVARQPAPPAPPDVVSRPSLTDLETIAQGYIGDYYSAASGGLADFEVTVGDDPNWGTFWSGLAGNVMWAAACFITGPGAVAGRQFALSLTGIGVGAVGANLSVSSKSEFHQAAVAQHLDAINLDLNNQVKAVTASVDADAAKNNWADNRTRLELLRRLMRPEFIMTATGGLPNVNLPRIRQRVHSDLVIQANSVGGGKKKLYQTGDVIYNYDVWGAVDEGAWYERNTVAPTREWTFVLRRLVIRLFDGGEAGVEALKRVGMVEPAKIGMKKTVKFTAVGSGIFFDDEFKIILDDKNQILSFVTTGIFDDMFDGEPGIRVYAENALRKVWSSSGGLPEAVPASKVESYESYGAGAY